MLDPGEQRVLQRPAAGLVDADVALLDEARTAAVEAPRRSDTWSSTRRRTCHRCNFGWSPAVRATFVDPARDLAEATGPVVYSGWDEVLRICRVARKPAVEELLHAYRVPREIMELALPLLEDIAPDVAPPIAYRTGPVASGGAARRTRRSCSSQAFRVAAAGGA